MKLVLASQGFTTPEIAQAVAKLVGKPLDRINVAVINEAYVNIAAGEDERWLINELSQIEDYTNGKISFVNLRAYPIEEIAKRLEFADLIYIVGGAQGILSKLFSETGFDRLLASLANEKVIMGTSAGAYMLGRHIEDPAYWKDQYRESEKYLTSPSLGFADFNILPHFEREDHPLRNKTQLTPLLEKISFPLYGITDTQAVIVDNDEVAFVGGNPIVFGCA